MTDAEMEEQKKAAKFVLDCELCGINIISADECGSGILDRYLTVKFTIPENFSVDTKILEESFGHAIAAPMQLSQQDLIDHVKNYFYETIADDNGTIDENDKKFFKFLCKVREGETWTAESLINKLKELEEKEKQIREAAEGWKDV
jgi:hypothetical protein